MSSPCDTVVRVYHGYRLNVRNRTVEFWQRVYTVQPMMEDYKGEDWIGLYQAALTELEHAKMTGRVEAARTAIIARMEKLQTLPGLHPLERQGIEDALRGLKLLEQEEVRFNGEEKRRAVEESLEKLRSVGSTIQRLRERANDPE